MEAKLGSGSFKQQRKSTMKASQSGIVIHEATESETSNNSNETDNLNPQHIFKRDADQYMPIANVTRIMRRILPPHAKIADDAKETIQECVSEFIGFVTAEANERCHREYRKTITPQDVIASMASLGFDNYAEPLSAYFDKIRNRGLERDSKQGYHARAGDESFPQPKIQVISRMQPTNYAPPPGTYNVNDENGIGGSQMKKYYYVKNIGGGHGEGSSNNLGFDPYCHFK